MGDNIKKIIDAVLEAEGGAKTTDDPSDTGGRTQFGISENAHPEAWIDDQVSEEEAREIYRRKYVEGPGFSRINDVGLQHFLVDWGVNSGPTVAVKYLQRVVGTPIDGMLGPKTAQAANQADPRGLLNRLIDERIRMFARIVNKNRSQGRFIEGWIERALEFRVWS
jgi:lysozyme family protein